MSREAKRFLREALKDQSLSFAVLRRRAASKGISLRSLYRAAHGLNVTSTMQGFGSNKKATWSLGSQALEAMKEKRRIIERERARAQRYARTADTEEERAAYHLVWHALRNIQLE